MQEESLGWYFSIFDAGDDDECEDEEDEGEDDDEDAEGDERM